MTMFQALYGLYNVEDEREERILAAWLIANKTIDEAYYWIGQRKIKQAGSMGEKMVKHVEKNPSPNVLDAYV